MRAGGTLGYCSDTTIKKKLAEISKGSQGEYIKGLVALLNITDEKEKSEAFQKIQSPGSGYKDAVSFAESIIRNFSTSV